MDKKNVDEIMEDFSVEEVNDVIFRQQCKLEFCALPQNKGKEDVAEQLEECKKN
jgi:hypothetical protein